MKVKGKIAVLLSVILGVTINVPGVGVKGATPASPENVHEETIYTYDYNTGVMTSDKSDDTWTGWANSPLMFPGDRVVVIGKDVDYSQGGTITVYKGMVFENNGEFTTESEGPIEVIKTEEYGVSVDDTHENLFITEFKITGENIVKLYSRGGGGYADEETVNNNGDEITICYYMNYLNYYTLPTYCKVSYDVVYYNNGWVTVGEDILKDAMYIQKNPDIIYAEDAIYNKESNNYSYSICRPYIEGFKICTNGSVGQVDTSQVYNLNAESGNPFAANIIETYYPKWTYFNSSGTDMIGSYDDEIIVQFKMEPTRTVTFDTCGGSLDDQEIVIKEYITQYYAQQYPEYMADGTFTPTREGYEFKGWFKDKTYTEEVTADNVFAYIESYSTSSTNRAARICRMYAKWEKIGGEDTDETDNPTGKTDEGSSDIGNNNGDGKVDGSDGATTDTEADTKTVKAANTLKVKGKTVTVKYKKLKKKEQTIAKKKAFAVSGAKGKVTFKKISGNKKITVNKKTGKITVKKGLKKKTYKIKVKVTAAGNENYKALSKTVTVKIKVK